MRVALAVAAAVGAGFWWARSHPSACPYSQRWMLDLPRGGLTPAKLVALLRPVAGERMLELGPGTGIYSLPVAELLAPGGRLGAFDLQQEMLDHLMREAGEQELTNIDPKQGDAAELPYADNWFDGAFLVTVLGEIPDQDAALRELRRVVKPGGRVVFGETLLDPHVVSPGALRKRAEAAGFAFEEKTGSPLGWYARFGVPG
jgi:ubiquinone/menaquinone biosynthesis C-methylase UbiE